MNSQYFIQLMALARAIGPWKPPKIIKLKPKEYEIHLSKSERRDKTYKELQEIRKSRIEDWGKE